MGKGDERGKLFLDVEKCRQALAKTQALRDSFSAAKVLQPGSMTMFMVRWGIA